MSNLYTVRQNVDKCECLKNSVLEDIKQRTGGIVEDGSGQKLLQLTHKEMVISCRQSSENMVN